jgi:hypothetical protein
MIILLAVLTLLFFINSCSLDRSNPLDPSASSDVSAPGRVSEITFSKITSPQNTVVLRWSQLLAADGYYVYRALSLHTVKERIATIEFGDIEEYSDTQGITSGRQYFYWLSAFIEYPQGRLEGKLSDYVRVEF